MSSAEPGGGASAWRFLGEGNANVVVSFNDTSAPQDSPWRGSALRLRKRKADAVSDGAGHAANQDRAQLKSAPAAFTVQQVHAHWTQVASLLDGFVQPGTLVPMPSSFVEALSLLIHNDRPDIRKNGCDATVLDEHAGHAILMPNLSAGSERICVPPVSLRTASCMKAAPAGPADVDLSDASNTTSHPAADKGHRQLSPLLRLCVEVKPKCGCLPQAAFVGSDAAACRAKATVSRFQMHQVFKAKEKEAAAAASSTCADPAPPGASAAHADAAAGGAARSPQSPPLVSKYDPLDLFSGHQGRIRGAVRALVESPQNNFAVFISSKKVFPCVTSDGEGSGGDAQRCVEGSGDGGLNDILTELLPAPPQCDEAVPSVLDSLTHAVADALLSSGALERILRLQRLDDIDVHSIARLYRRVSEQTVPGGGMDSCQARDFGLKCISEAIASGAFEPSAPVLDEAGAISSSEVLEGFDLSPDEIQALDCWPECSARVAIGRFLLATCAKDCSVLLAFDAFPAAPGAVDLCDFVCHAVHVIDVDPKPAHKIPKYLAMDRQIVAAYLNAPTR